MKTIITVILLLTLSINSTISQSTDCCDSLIQLYNEKTTKKTCEVVIKEQTPNLGISIDNYHNGNNNLQLNPKKEEKESRFNSFFKYFKEFIGPLVALLGILLAIPILRKKLLENHITNALNKIQETNSVVHALNQNLIDKYIPLTFNNNILRKKDIETVFKEIKEIYYISLNGSSDVVTTLFYLKNTIQGTLKHYNPKTASFISTRELYGLIIETLEIANFYCTQVVQVPKSTRTETKNIINKKLQKFVTHSDYLKYKHFNQGIINDPNSAHFTLFYSKINSLSTSIIKRAAFQIYWAIAPVAKFLYLSEIYAPLEIEMPHSDPLFGSKSLKLYLIGYTNRNQLTMADGTTKKIVELIYSNPNDFHRFASNLKFNTIKNDFKDTYIIESNFHLNQANKMTRSGIETFKLQFDRRYLEEMFKKNKSKLKDKLLSEIKNGL